MSNDVPVYNPIFIKAWLTLSVVLGLILLVMFIFGGPLLLAGKGVWDLLRWLASPLI